MSKEILNTGNAVKRKTKISDSSSYPLLARSAPTGNTGAQIPSAPGSKIDTLEFRLASPCWSSIVREYLRLNPDDFESRDAGMRTYPCSEVYGTVFVCHDPHRPERGVKVVMGSQALEQINRGALELCKLILRDGGSITRIDLALDDRQGLLSMDRIWKSVETGEVVSHFKNARPWYSVDLSTGKRNPGRTYYFGSTQSLRQVRIYDKRAERVEKGEYDPGHWVRVEVQANKNAAMNLAASLVQNGLEKSGAIIASIIDFREKAGQKNTTRRERLSWWQKFIATVEKIPTGLGKLPRTIEEKAKWIGQQCAKTLYEVTQVLGVDFLQSVINAGFHKSDPAKIEKLAAQYLAPNPREYVKVSGLWASPSCPF